MVATDVASRGIGMIETPPPSIAMPSRLYRSALLSTLRRFLACVTLPGLCRVLRFSIRGNLGSVVQHFSCYTRNSMLKVSSGYRGGIGIS
jgi:ATP-dependent RNA helicase DDX5/DBP2